MDRRGITLNVKKNPFNCNERELHQLEYEPSKTVAEYCGGFVEIGVDFCYGINGVLVDENAVPQDGDFITLCPVQGKNILSTILTVGLMVFTGGLYGAAGIGAFGIKAGTFLAGLVQASVMAIGGALISMLCPSQTADITIDTSSSDPVYSWGTIESQTQQGGALAKTYGSMKTAGTVLSRHVSTDGTNQYLNLLLTGGEGPIDSITDIRINDNPVGNYDGVTVEIRLGTNDQTVIAGFDDSPADQGLSFELELDGGYSTQLTEGTATQGLEVTLECSNGLYYMNDNSSLGNATVTYKLQYRLANNYWIDWGTFEISGSSSSAIRSVQRVDNLEPGQYEVRAQCVSKSGTSSRYSTRIFWTQVTTIVYDDFIRPNKVLVAIKALATSQLSGSNINVTWIQTRLTVFIHNGLQYVTMPATNAAWAAYDYVHSCRKLKNINTGQDEYHVDNVPASRMIYDDFAAWADHFDELELSFNHIVTEATDLWEALKVPEVFGRGKVIQRGTKYGCTCDKPGSPVQMFTVGNIGGDSFSKDILPITDRANCVEISFVNKNKNYTKDTFCVYSDNYDTEGVIKSPTQITLSGCTSYDQAYKHGKYLLRLNKLELRTITFKADIDAINCQYGDQILVQHDVPSWGSGGRIVKATANTLTLDQHVSMLDGNMYGIIVRLQDDSLVTKSVIISPGDTNEVTVASPFNVIPQAQDLYSFGLVEKIAKPFVIIDIDRDEDNRAEISAIEYVAAVYEESINAPVVNYFDTSPKNLSITANEILPRPSISSANVLVKWAGSRDARVTVIKITANGVEKHKAYAGINGLAMIVVGDSPIYEIVVDAIDTFGNLVATGKINFASTYVVENVSGLSCTQHYREIGNGQINYELQLNWAIPVTTMFDHADVFYKSTAVSGEELIIKLEDIEPGTTWGELGLKAMSYKFAGKGDKNFIFTGAVIGATYEFMVVAVDKNGVPADSSDAPVVSYTVGVKTTTPITPSGLAVIMKDGKPVASWAANADTDIDFYELRVNSNAGADDGLLFRGYAVQCSPSLPARSAKLYLFAHNPSGHYSPSLTYTYNFPAADAPTMRISDVFHGIVVSTEEDVPTGCTGIIVLIDNGVMPIYANSPNNAYTYSSSGGVYEVSVAFWDWFGACTYCNPIPWVINATIDPAYIEEATIAADKLSRAAQSAFENMQYAVSGTMFNDYIAQMSVINENYGSQLTMLADSITGVVGELNKGPGNCSYTSVVQTPNSWGVTATDGTTESLFAITANDMRIKSKFNWISGDTKFDDNVIVGRMLSAQSITADKIYSLEGLTVQSNDGTFTKFEADGINWYTATGEKYASTRRSLSGTTRASKRVTFKHPWDYLPKITLTPAETPRVAGWDTSIQTYTLNPKDVAVSGFGVDTIATILSGKGSHTYSVGFDPWGAAWAPSSPTPACATSVSVTVHMNGGGSYNLYASWKVYGGSSWNYIDYVVVGPGQPGTVSDGSGGYYMTIQVASGLSPGQYLVQVTTGGASGMFNSAVFTAVNFESTGGSITVDTDINFSAVEVPDANDYYDLV